MILFWCIASALAAFVVCRIIAANETEDERAYCLRAWTNERALLVAHFREEHEWLIAENRQLKETLASEIDQAPRRSAAIYAGKDSLN